MNINKDNYEEYFLLYADNELSDREKMMVEEFVKQHTYLEEEFFTFKQLAFTPEDELTPEDKNALFRHTEKIINHNNYEEIFTLYIDNELTSLQRVQTEEFLAETPSLKNEFELLQRAKLQPDLKVTFPNKYLLFKREDDGKVIPFRGWKTVAAAVLLGMGILIGLDLQKRNTREVPATVKINIPEKPAGISPATTDTIISPRVNVMAGTNGLKHPLKHKALIQKNTRKLPVKIDNVAEASESDHKGPDNNLPVPGVNNNEVEMKGTPDVAGEVQNNKSMASENKNGENNDTVAKEGELAGTSKTSVPDVLTASYADESENNHNYAFYNITEEKFNKSKIGGFFRKVKRIIERKISPLNSSKNQREMAVN